MIHVVCGTDLLRDYLSALIAAADPRHLPARLLPLAPRPRGSSYSLAHVVLQALTDGDELSAAERRKQLLAPMSSRLLPQLYIDASRAGLSGLQRLLQLACAGASPRVQIQRPARGPRRYRLSVLQQPPFAETIDLVNEQGIRVERLLRWDHRLTYATGQTLLLGHNYHIIVAIDDQQIRVRHAEQAEQARQVEIDHLRRLAKRQPAAAALATALARQTKQADDLYAHGYRRMRRACARQRKLFACLEQTLPQSSRIPT